MDVKLLNNVQITDAVKDSLLLKPSDNRLTWLKIIFTFSGKMFRRWRGAERATSVASLRVGKSEPGQFWRPHLNSWSDQSPTWVEIRHQVRNSIWYPVKILWSFRRSSTSVKHLSRKFTIYMWIERWYRGETVKNIQWMEKSTPSQT